MTNLKQEIKNYLLLNYTKSRMEQSEHHLSNKISWIQRQSLLKTIHAHCNVLLQTLLEQNEITSLRERKFIVDSIFKYTFLKGEDLLKANKKIRDIKPYMQLNSYIVFDEIVKGLSENRGKKSIIFNIEKQLSDVQEKIDSKMSVEELLEERTRV